jgi:hypothetical protein
MLGQPRHVFAGLPPPRAASARPQCIPTQPLQQHRQCMVRDAGYIHWSPAALEILDNPDLYMSEAQLSNPRKRQRTEEHPLPSPPSSKRQKLQHHSLGCTEETPAFWDGLSKIWLTKRSLKELNRRNTAPHSSQSQARRPITRAFKAERTKIRQRISAAEFFNHTTSRHLKDIKRFARRGGPDLSGLIGVCIMQFLMFGA